MNDHPVEFLCIGTPVPQGSMRHVGNGRMLHKPQLLDWRSDLVLAARKVMDDRLPLDGPVVVHADFTLHRPKAAAKRVWPSVRPDVDKLARGLLDALTAAGVVEDDAQVVDLRARKVYVGHPLAMPIPGVSVRIEVAA